MAKITYRRTNDVHCLDLFVSIGLIVAASLFLIGSFFFWPRLASSAAGERVDLTWGSCLFIAGSVIYTVIPAIELRHQLQELGSTSHVEEAIDDQISAKEHFFNLTTQEEYVDALKRTGFDGKHSFCAAEAHNVRRAADRAGSFEERSVHRSKSTTHLLRRAVRARSTSLDDAPTVVWANATDTRLIPGAESEDSGVVGGLEHVGSGYERAMRAKKRETELRRLMRAENKDAPVLTVNDDDDEDDEEEDSEEVQLRAMLYQRFLVKCQQLQTLIFIVGGVIFTVGSVFFLPQANAWFDGDEHQQEAVRLTHGCWLFVAGSVVFMIGAYLGKKIGFELMLTGEPLRYNFWRGKHLHHLYWWSDERINVISCNVLMLGTGLYVLGTLFFFPGWPQWTAPGLGYAATCLFIVGSCCFVLSAVAEYLRLRRTHSKYTQFDVEHDESFFSQSVPVSESE